MHNRFTSNFFILLCIFLSTHLLILYLSQVVSDNPTNDFINSILITPEEGFTAAIFGSRRQCLHMCSL
jgi:hypothetical protein